jgi:hypothetical protein
MQTRLWAAKLSALLSRQRFVAAYVLLGSSLFDGCDRIDFENFWTAHLAALSRSAGIRFLAFSSPSREHSAHARVHVNRTPEWFFGHFKPDLNVTWFFRSASLRAG